MNLQRCWAEIDLVALEHNARVLRSRLPHDCGLIGIVKADAYGHGAVAVARRLERVGVKYYAVACVAEAMELRTAGVTEPILILGYSPPECVPELIEHNITQTVVDEAAALAYNAAAAGCGAKLTCHLKIDTGMTRFGAAEADVAALTTLPHLNVEGVFTHLPVSDESDADSTAFTVAQIERFRRIAEPLNVCYKHCANSGGVLLHPTSVAPPFNLARPGIALYGYFAGYDALRPAMSWYTRVCQLRDIAPGTTVGYGRTWTATRHTRVAVCSVGYADGLNRRLSNNGEFWLNGCFAPIIGRVCMDLTMIDVTDVPDVRVGDATEIFGEHARLERMASRLDTITYELLCNVSERPHRVPRTIIDQSRYDI